MSCLVSQIIAKIDCCFISKSLKRVNLFLPFFQQRPLKNVMLLAKNNLERGALEALIVITIGTQTKRFIFSSIYLITFLILSSERRNKNV